MPMLPYLSKPSPCVQKLDRLNWADGVSFEAYGARIGVRVSCHEAMPDLLAILPPGWKRSESAEVEEIVSYQVGGAGSRPGSRNYHLVYLDSVRFARTHDPAEAQHAVESTAQLAVALRAKQRIFIHAGAVAWRGRMIILPGRSFAGKSKLVEALLKAGADYYSDEYAVLDAQGLVHPYPRRLSIREADGVARRRLTAEDLGSRTGVEPLPVGMIAITKFQPNANWSGRPVSAAKAALALFNNAVAAQHQPQTCLSTIQSALSGAVCLQGARGDAAETAELLLNDCHWNPL